MKRKWKDARGETLVEVMASILIGALSVVLLFTAVLSSSKMGKTAQTQTVDGRVTEAWKFNKALKAAEEQTTPASSSEIPGSATVTVAGKIKNPDGTETATASVTLTLDTHDVPEVIFYGGEDALSYKLNP